MSGTARVLVAPDKFKGSLTAAEVAAHVRVGLHRARPDLTVVELPVADGGDGTVDAAVAGGFTARRVTVTGPLGEPVTATFALRDGTAVVEMAEASGLRLVPADRPAPRTATSHGTGELIAAALDAGADTVVLGVGGSATTDGGAGMLTALGARLTDPSGAPLAPGGAALRDLADARLDGLDPRLASTRIVLASDVDNPLTGPQGAAAVYGPQKGADPADVAVLDAGLDRLARVMAAVLGPRAVGVAEAAGAGAAGGTGFAALVALGAEFRPGIDVLLDVLGFGAALEGADAVVTGEGSLDAQTLRGKAPAGVAAAAGRAGVPVYAVCGRREIGPEEAARAGLRAVYPLTELEPDPATSMAHAGPLVERAAAALAARHF